MQKKHPLQDALFVATQLNMRVIPVYGNLEFGGCTCGNPNCQSPGKHPVGGEWQKRASKDPEVIKELFKGLSAEYNYGIATGPESGIFVVDVDGDVGKASLKDLTDKNGILPVTLTCNTGNGFHLFFKYPEGRTIKGKASKLAPNVDIRGNGNQVVGSGSVHHSGRVYQWDNPLEDVSDAPQWLIDMICEENNNQHKLAQNSTDGLNLNTNRLSSLNLDRRHSNDEVIEMLSFLDPGMGHDDWLYIGMALHDGGYPFHIWDDWSKGGVNYTGDTAIRWKSFHGGKGMSMGTLVKMARDAGYHKNIVENKINDILNKHSKEQVTAPELIKNNPEDATDNNCDKKEENKAEEPRKNKFFYTNAPDINIDLEVNDFVQGLLTENAMSVVYGESNCGKTFFMSDLAFHVAQGKRYNGRRVEKGNVLYLSLEGKRGIKNRIAAYKMENNVDLDGFLMMPCQVDFINSEDDIPQLVELIMEANKAFDHNIKLVVVDTLARAIGGGDENSGVDMGTLVKHSDLIRQYTNAHICFIHHSGKNKALGARGHSSLRAAVDTEIEISRAENADYSTVKIPKQRDMDRDNDFYFKLKRVVLGMNRWMEEVTSCVVEPFDIATEVEANVGKRIKSGKTKTAYDALKEAIMEKGFRGSGPDMPPCKVVTIDIFKKYLEKRGVLSDNTSSHRRQFIRVHDDLIENKLIVVRDNYIWLPVDLNVI